MSDLSDCSRSCTGVNTEDNGDVAEVETKWTRWGASADADSEADADLLFPLPSEGAHVTSTSHLMRVDVDVGGERIDGNVDGEHTSATVLVPLLSHVRSEPQAPDENCTHTYNRSVGVVRCEWLSYADHRDRV